MLAQQPDQQQQLQVLYNKHVCGNIRRQSINMGLPTWAGGEDSVGAAAGSVWTAGMLLGSTDP